jgi:hypothetical protein
VESEPSSIKGHVIALVGNVTVFASLSVAVYTISVVISADLGGPLTCCAAPLLSGMCAAVYFPITIVTEQLLVSRLKLGRKKRYWVMAIAYCVSGLVLVFLGALLVGAGYYSNWLGGLWVVLFYGIPLVIGGPMYVLLLHMSSLLSAT